MAIIRVTGIQMAVGATKGDNLPKILEHIKSSDCDILLFPEMSLTGYNNDFSDSKTLEAWQQIATAFGEVSNSFQYLVNYWSTIIELLSIHKRLKAFEAAIDDKPLPDIDERYLQRAADEGELAANEP